MGMIIKVTLEVTTDSSDWDPPEDVPTIGREMIFAQDHQQPRDFVRRTKERFASILDDAIREIVNVP